MYGVCDYHCFKYRPNYRYPTPHAALLVLIDYMPLMDVWRTEMERDMRANLNFRNVHGVGR